MANLNTILGEVPASRGALITDRDELSSCLEGAVADAEDNGFIGALVLIRVCQPGGLPLAEDELTRASYLLAQLARQADVMAQVGVGTLGMVLKRLPRRADVHVMLNRIEDFISGSEFGWEISTGAGVFPLCGSETQDAWSAARRDLLGAMSRDSWQHEIPRETIRTRFAG